MNGLGIFILLLGVVYLIYSIVFSAFKQETIFPFRYVKIVEGNDKSYLKLQLYFSVLNALIFIGIGIAAILYDISSVRLILIVLIFHLVNLIMKIISRIKGNIKEMSLSEWLT